MGFQLDNTHINESRATCGFFSSRMLLRSFAWPPDWNCVRFSESSAYVSIHNILLCIWTMVHWYVISVMAMFEILTTWDHREMRQDCRLSALFSDGMSQTDPMWSSVRWPLGQLCALVIEAFSPDSWSLQFSSARSTLSPRESASIKSVYALVFSVKVL